MIVAILQGTGLIFLLELFLAIWICGAILAILGFVLCIILALIATIID